MRKFGFGVSAAILAGLLYYFILGKTQLITEVKRQVNTQLMQIQQEGFSVSNRKVQKQKEYFEIAFTDTQKALHFLSSRGVAVTQEDIEKLNGSKLGIALHYLPENATSLALDITPLSLPAHLTKDIQLLPTLLQKKAIQVHLALNPLGTAFKGYLKDINETNEAMHLQVKSLSFTADLKQQKLHTFTQNLAYLSISIPQLQTSLTNLTSNYTQTKANTYKNSYTIASLNMATQDYHLHSKGMSIDTNTSIDKHLASIIAKIHSRQIDISTDNTHYILNDVNLTTTVDKLDISAFEKLQTINTQNKEEMHALLAKLLSAGVGLYISEFSAAEISLGKKSVAGFTMDAHANMDKHIPIAKIEKNLLNILPYLDANLKIALSPALMNYIRKDPRVMLAMMMFQPKDKNGKKIYNLELKKGKIRLNGKSLL